MGYDVSLHKVPAELKGQHIDEDVLFDIAYEEDEGNLLHYTNFSIGNPNAADFASVFDLLLTNNGFYKIVTVDDYNQARNRLQTTSLNDSLLERVSKFLDTIDHELQKGETIFFWCD
ncbi:hypothetical protein CHH61_03480 [Shouchella clausii]|uniref:Uncharacterized protein n=1 Tax=Shouchella clausii TaxID=79880 RepID=A0A268S4B8_SHOCL|nr:hypothetical protein [Shouchella clausii]PAF27393.1 hypothetical protein CHH61_03480 [Shouchella clausii]